MAYEKMGNPVACIDFHGKSYPVWKVTHGRKTVTVSSMSLFDKVSCAQLMATANPQVDAVEQKIDYYVGPDEGQEVVVELMKTVRCGVR